MRFQSVHSTTRLALASLMLMGAQVSAEMGVGALGGRLGLAEAAANPFRVEIEPPKDLLPGKSGVIRLTVVVPEGFHVYRDMMGVKVLDAGGLELGEASFPPGLQAPDPANPGATREQYDMNVVIEVPVKAGSKQGNFNTRFEVRYQGCKKTLCYMPATDVLDATIQVGKGTGEAAEPSRRGDPSWQNGALVQTLGGSEVSNHPFRDLPPQAVVEKVDGEGKKHPVVARLLADRPKVAPGETVRLGVHLTMAPGWHTYWQTPGDIGLPTEITWTLPDGWSAQPYEFPIPHRYDVQGIVSHGYEGEVLFFSDVSVPATTPLGKADVEARVKWLVCESTCIPGEALLKLPIEVASGSVSGPAASLFDSWAKQLPVPSENTKVAFTSTLSAEALQPNKPFSWTLDVTVPGGHGAKVEGGVWPAFAPILPTSVFVTGVQVTEVDAEKLRVEIKGEALEVDPLPTADQIGGLFQFQTTTGPLATELVTGLPWKAAAEVVKEVPPPATVSGKVLGATGLFANAKPTEEAPKAAAVATPVPAVPTEDPSLIWMLLLAFLGGGVLNVMPCVLPVLTLKVYSLVEQRDIDPMRRRNAGLVYSAGVISSFLVLAIVLVVAKLAFGVSVGWGSQMQYPAYVMALATIVFAFGLSLFGVFEVPAIGANAAAGASQKGGYIGYFLTGVFTTLLATPCSAPLLGPAMGFAFTLPAAGIFAFFAVAGLGLASPFLVIAFIPSLKSLLPRPGDWMETFKQFMGFTLMATTVWLVDVIGGLLGRDAMFGFLVFLTGVGLGAWIFGKFGSPIETGMRQVQAFVVGTLVAAGIGYNYLSLEVEAQAASAVQADVQLDWSKGMPWVPFSEGQVDALAGKTVFIDFTADWCVTCKVNEKTVLADKDLHARMKELGVVPLKGDWTRGDPVITAWLERYGRAGVPFYVVIPADRSRAPIPLGEVITVEDVVKAVESAS